MKIANLQQGTNIDFENRKKAFVRKEMDQAYKKSAKYADALKNPLLIALENLLSGKTDKELFEADTTQSSETTKSSEMTVNLGPELTNGTRENEPTQQATQATNSQPSSMDESDETIALLEKVRQAALTPAQPSTQDLRVAASAQLTRSEADAEALSEVAPYADEDLTFDVPERFLSDVGRNANTPTLFGKELEKLLFTRTFTKATEKYKSHIAMVKNNYLSYNEPQFSRTA